MTAAVVVIVLVAGTESRSPITAAAVAAANEALGAQVALILRSAPVPSDQEALRQAGLTAATAVGTIAWTDARHDQATIRVHASGTQAWTEHVLAFAATDSPEERGRALGLALAAMVTPAIELASRERPSDAGRGPPKEPDPSAPAAGSEPAPAADTPPAAAAADGTRADGWSAELRALAVRGVGGPAGGWGLAAAAQGPGWLGLRPRLDASVRTGDILGLGGHHRVAALVAGVAWHAPGVGGLPPLGWGARLQAGATLHDFAHEAPDGALIHEMRVLPAALAAAEVSWRLTPRFDLVAGLGVELALGKTEVIVASVPIATVPPLRAQAELGGRLWF